MGDFVTRDEFSIQQTNFMREITEIKRGVNDVQRDIVDIKLLFAEFPKKLADEFDKRYAKKELECDVKDLKEKQEASSNVRETRNYDWLKYATVTLVGIVVFLAVYSKF